MGVLTFVPRAEMAVSQQNFTHTDTRLPRIRDIECYLLRLATSRHSRDMPGSLGRQLGTQGIGF